MDGLLPACPGGTPIKEYYTLYDLAILPVSLPRGVTVTLHLPVGKLEGVVESGLGAASQAVNEWLHNECVFGVENTCKRQRDERDWNRALLPLQHPWGLTDAIR